MLPVASRGHSSADSPSGTGPDHTPRLLSKAERHSPVAVNPRLLPGDPTFNVQTDEITGGEKHDPATATYSAAKPRFSDGRETRVLDGAGAGPAVAQRGYYLWLSPGKRYLTPGWEGISFSKCFGRRTVHVATAGSTIFSPVSTDRDPGHPSSTYGWSPLDAAGYCS